MSDILDLFKRLDNLNEDDRKVVQHYLSNKWPTSLTPDKEAAAFEEEADSIELPEDVEDEVAIALPSAVKKSDYIPGKRGRRKGQVDTNSVRQRVFCAVRNLLKGRKLHCHEVWRRVQEQTGIPYDVVRVNAFHCPGIHRAEYWSLEAA